MPSQSVTLRFEIPEAWDAGDALQVYTDFGTGTIDTTKPLLPKPFEPFPNAVRTRGYGEHSHGVGCYGTLKPARPPRGIEHTVWGVTPWGTSPPTIDLVVDVPAAFGLWTFAAVMTDAMGNPQSGAGVTAQVMVSGTDPGPPTLFAFNAFDAGNDVVTFDVAWGND